MKVGNVIIRQRDTMMAEINGWKKVDKIIKIEGAIYTLESGNIFPKDVLEHIYDLKTN